MTAKIEGPRVTTVSQPRAVADVVLEAVAAVGSASEQLVGSGAR